VELSELTGCHVSNEGGKGFDSGVVGGQVGEVGEALGEHSETHSLDDIEDCHVSDTQFLSNEPLVVAKDALEVGEVLGELLIVIRLGGFSSRSEDNGVRDTAEIVGMGDQSVNIGLLFFIGGHEATLSGSNTETG